MSTSASESTDVSSPWRRHYAQTKHKSGGTNGETTTQRVSDRRGEGQSGSRRMRRRFVRGSFCLWPLIACVSSLLRRCCCGCWFVRVLSSYLLCCDVERGLCGLVLIPGRDELGQLGRGQRHRRLQDLIEEELRTHSNNTTNQSKEQDKQRADTTTTTDVREGNRHMEETRAWCWFCLCVADRVCFRFRCVRVCGPAE